MTPLLLIAVWMVGYVLAYLMAKFERWLSDKPWTVGARRGALLVSISSWLFVCIMIVSLLLCAAISVMIDSLDNDKPAKW